MMRWIMLGHVATTISQGVPEFRCMVPVLPGGDGADTAPLEERTEACNHWTNVLIGSAPTCAHHLELVARIGEIPLEDMLGHIEPLACPEPVALIN